MSNWHRAALVAARADDILPSAPSSPRVSRVIALLGQQKVLTP